MEKSCSDFKRAKEGGEMTKVNPIQMQKYLKGVDYPAGKKDLVKQAKKNGADKSIVSVLEHLSDEEFETPAEVSKAVGHME